MLPRVVVVSLSFGRGAARVRRLWRSELLDGPRNLRHNLNETVQAIEGVAGQTGTDSVVFWTAPVGLSALHRLQARRAVGADESRRTSNRSTSRSSA